MKLGQLNSSNGGIFTTTTVRRVLFVLAGLACVVTVLSYIYSSPGGGRGIQLGDSRQSPGTAPPQPEETSPRDPAQLVPRKRLASEEPINPVTRVSKGQKVSVVEKETLSEVLKAVKKHPQSELRKSVDRSIAWKHFDTARGRRYAKGRLCRVEGVLRRFKPVKGIDMSTLPVDAIYEGQIQDAAGRWYSLYCFEKPQGERSRSRNAVLVGVFYKVIQYTTRKGDKLVTPLIVGRTVEMRPIDAAPAPPGVRLLTQLPRWSLWPLGVAGAGLLGLLLWLGRNSRRAGTGAGSAENIDELDIEFEDEPEMPEGPEKER